MPGKLKVRVVAGRGLPVMDRATDLTDAFVEVRFANEVQKTDVFKRSLNPHWNSDWIRFETEDEVLQDEPLEFRVLDHDTYSAHDAIGKVYIDLNPLLVKGHPSLISGWFPIYDTMHGIRGELNVIIKVDLFSDFNKFRQSSCGVQYFCTSEVPVGFRLQFVHGFVEELVVNDDPEYQWIDKIRTPRASNEARQRLFSKMSGTLQRKIGLKVLEMGGSAVIGYNQCFDLEGESGIVVRGIGTAVTLAKLHPPPVSPLGVSPLKELNHLKDDITDCRLGNYQSFLTPSSIPSSARHSLVIADSNSSSPSTPHRRLHQSRSNPLSKNTTAATNFAFPSPAISQTAFDFPCSSPLPEESIAPSSPPLQTQRSTTSPVKVSVSMLNRRSSDSDLSANTPPKGNSLTGSSGSGSGAGSGTKSAPKLCSQQVNIEMMEFPLFTMQSFPPGFIIHLGGIVSARSVKLLDKIHNPEEPETRDVWWMEIRTEIRSHIRAMGCHAVIGYREETSICDEIIILSAVGTAAKVNLNSDNSYLNNSGSRPNPQLLAASLDKYLQIEKDREKEKRLFVDVNLANQVTLRGQRFDGTDDTIPAFNCSLCHIPYKPSSAPFPVNLSQCAICRRRNVPDVLFTTISPPNEIQTIGKGAFIQARICRPKTSAKGEANAKEISDILPFMEYDIHSQLMNKLKICGMNGLFGLKVQIAVGETMVVALATATGAYLAPLPPPAVPRLLGQVTSEEENVSLLELQKEVLERVRTNKELYHLQGVDNLNQPSPRSVNTNDSDEEMSDLELSNGNKNTFVLQVDDTRDEGIRDVLQDVIPPAGIQLSNTESMPGTPHNNIVQNLQMFTQVWRSEVPQTSSMKQDFIQIFQGLLRKIFFKLRRLKPCCLLDLNFNLEVPYKEEVQVVVSGICVAVDDSPGYEASYVDLTASNKGLLKTAGSGASGDVEDMMFQMEEVTDAAGSSGVMKVPRNTRLESYQRKISRGFINVPGRVELTPLPYIPGMRIEKYLGSYNFFFIRETTALREMGGVCGFMQSFISEVYAIVRANVASLGGNALVAYKMTESVLLVNPHKSQCQCLINVCGDAVCCSMEGEITTAVPDLSRKHSDSPISTSSSQIITKDS